jgi:hypothetical protein
MTPGVPRMPAPTIESFAQCMRTRSARLRLCEFAPHRLDVLASTMKNTPASLTLIMSIETSLSAARRKSSRSSIARPPSSLALDHAEERDVAQRRDAGDGRIAVVRRVPFVDRRADVLRRPFTTYGVCVDVREFGRLRVHHLGAVGRRVRPSRPA